MTSSQQIRKALGCSGSVPKADLQRAKALQGTPGPDHAVGMAGPKYFEAIQKFIEENTANGITPLKTEKA